MADINTLLKDRGEKYGSFASTSKISQDIKKCMSEAPNWHLLSYEQKEALEMIAVKIGRILNGNPNHTDSWVDIVGYATLGGRSLKTKSDLSDLKVGRKAHV
jgi:hypothetical protein